MFCIFFFFDKAKKNMWAFISFANECRYERSFTCVDSDAEVVYDVTNYLATIFSCFYWCRIETKRILV